MINKTCAICGSAFNVIPSRTNAKYCSRKCSDESKKAKANVCCDFCKTPFHMKQFQVKRYARTIGIFCSTTCLSEAKRTAYEGSKNPNYKSKNVDSDGYRIVSPSARRTLGHTMKRLHQVVACESLGIKTIPKGFHVHHRDCDPMNNRPQNLAVLSVSDHKWLHKQFGVAVLWAYSKGKISKDELCKWSDDIHRTVKLIDMNVTNQKIKLVEADELSDTQRGTGGLGSTGA